MTISSRILEKLVGWNCGSISAKPTRNVLRRPLIVELASIDLKASGNIGMRIPIALLSARKKRQRRANVKWHARCRDFKEAILPSLPNQGLCENLRQIDSDGASYIAGCPEIANSLSVCRTVPLDLRRLGSMRSGRSLI